MKEGDWTSWEKRIYKLIRNRRLGPSYAEMSLTIDKPKMRLDYLREKFLNPSECETINPRWGKPITLMRLENLAVKKYF